MKTSAEKSGKLLSISDEISVKQAIINAELNTSGEIRIHIEEKCAADVLDRAAYVFEKLDMHKTKLRNGVLFYLATKDQKFAVIGDAGINAVVPPSFWDDLKAEMTGYFRMDQFAEGLISGIQKTGERLQKHFPYQQDDKNELSNEISFGKV